MRAFAAPRLRESIPSPLVGEDREGVEPSRSDSRCEGEI